MPPTTRRLIARYLTSGYLIPLVLACFLAACGVPVGAQQVTATPLAEIESFRSDSGITTPLRTAVSDTEAWRALWESVTSTAVSPKPDLPAVNFATETLIVAALGICPAGGCAIEITGVYEKDGRLYAEVRETVPGKDCLLLQVVTYPLAIVRVEQTGMPVIFVMKRETKNC